jgi:hypothetical protein
MRYDANIFFYTKASLAKFCDCEDSYWRFFMDTWIQSILMGTDSWLLLFSELLSAGAMEELFRAALSKPVAFLYASAAFVVRRVELEVEAFLIQTEDQSAKPFQWTRKGVDSLKGPEAAAYGDPAAGAAFEKAHLRMMGKSTDQLLADGVIKKKRSLLHWLKSATEFVDNFAIFTQFLQVQKKLPPPPTLRRKRPSKDWVEWFAYHKGRMMRNFNYNMLQAETAFGKLARQTLFWTGVLRVACLLGFAPQIRFVCLMLAEFLGYKSASEQHVAWIHEFHGLAVFAGTGSATRLSDWVVTSLVLPTVSPYWAVLTLPLVPPLALLSLLDTNRPDLLGWLLTWAVYSVGLFYVQRGTVKSTGFRVLCIFATIPLFKAFHGNLPFYVCMVPPMVHYGFKKMKATVIANQQKRFASQWSNQDIWGDMSRDEPCKGYETLSFVHPMDAQKAKDRWSLLAWLGVRKQKGLEERDDPPWGDLAKELKKEGRWTVEIY